MAGADRDRMGDFVDRDGTDTPLCRSQCNPDTRGNRPRSAAWSGAGCPGVGYPGGKPSRAAWRVRPRPAGTARWRGRARPGAQRARDHRAAQDPSIALSGGERRRVEIARRAVRWYRPHRGRRHPGSGAPPQRTRHRCADRRSQLPKETWPDCDDCTCERRFDCRYLETFNCDACRHFPSSLNDRPNNVV